MTDFDEFMDSLPDTDKDALKTVIFTSSDEVFIGFSKPTTNQGYPPEAALALSEAIREASLYLIEANAKTETETETTH